MIFSQIFDMVDAGIAILDRDLVVFKWNRWLEAHSRMPAKDVVGKSIFSIFPDLEKPWFNRNCKSVFAFGNFAFFSQKLHKFCFPFPAPGAFAKQFNYMQQSCTMGPLRDENNQIEYMYIMVQDVTEIAAYEKKLIEMNNKDGLTGTFNRRYLEAKIKEEFSRHKRYNRPFSVIMFDIDHFKKVNDTYGHQGGDFILVKLASMIMKGIREVDILARYGGEEFSCLLPETSLEQAAIVAERQRAKVEQKIFLFEDLEIKITISQGISEIRDHITTAEELIKAADEALYEAKETGRNRVVMMKD